MIMREKRARPCEWLKHACRKRAVCVNCSLVFTSLLSLKHASFVSLHLAVSSVYRLSALLMQ